MTFVNSLELHGPIFSISEAFLAPSAPSAPSAPVLRGSHGQQTSSAGSRHGGHAMTVGLATAAVALARRRTVVRAEAGGAEKLSGSDGDFLFPLWG